MAKNQFFHLGGKHNSGHYSVTATSWTPKSFSTLGYPMSLLYTKYEVSKPPLTPKVKVLVM